MKKLLLIVLLALLVPLATKADVIEIGTGENFYDFPFHDWMNVSWDEEIYPMESFSSACVINSISYNNVGIYGMMFPVPSVANTLKIYMGERATAAHASNTDWTPLSDLTLVYSHENVVLGNECGWQEFVLDEPFLYEGNGNLVVVVARTTDSPGWDVNLYTTSYSSNGNVSLTYTSYNGSAEFPGEQSGQLDSQYADIQLNVSPVVITCPVPLNLVVDHVGSTNATVSWTAGIGTSAWDVYVIDGEAPAIDTPPTESGVSSTSYTFSGLNGLTNYTAYVRANCGEGDVSTWKSISFMTAPDFGGSGTPEMPYLLYTKEDLESLTTGMASGFVTLGKYFKIMNDIEGVTTPISGNFRGDFNGNGHTVNLNLEGPGDLALFATLGNGASVHDLTVDGVVNSTGERAAGLVAYIDWHYTVHISNCVNKASVMSNSDKVGGIVGNSFSSGTIENCVNKALIETTGSYCGGIVGYTFHLSVVNCENRGDIVCNARGGGIVGYHGGAIINCANKGSVTCSDRGGGVVGEASSASVRNCFNIGNLTVSSNSGGVSGYNINHASIENCYNGGMIISDNLTDCGALTGCNAGDGNTNGNNSYNHYNYFKEDTYPIAYGTNSNLVFSDNYTSFTQEGTSPVCTLAESMQGTTDLLTALNNWRDGNDTYAQWYNDLYGNNKYMPAFTEGTPPGLEVSPNPVVMAPRPIGAWMQGETVTLVNTSQEDLQVTGIEFDNAFFFVDESAGAVNYPMALEGEQSREVFIGTDPNAMTTPGTMTAQMSTIWNQTHMEQADIEVLHYAPVSPDVVELAEVVTSFPQTITQNTDELYDNYRLPGNHPDAPDAVYQLVFSEGALLNAQVTTGSNAKLALYNEDFNGKPGPMVDNYCAGGDDPIDGFMVSQGSYYLVVSSTSPQYVLELTTDDLPVPVAATLVAPADGATDITAPLELQWQLGQFTTEYQLVVGTSYPPTEVLVDWTSDLAETFTIDNLRNNQIYFWRVNERNASGVTEGTVWHFTTTLNAPTELQTNTHIHEGEELLLHWTAAARSLMGYNVYQDGVKINESLVPNTDYAVADLAYNMEGYTFTVTAVYDEGESAPSNSVLVRVAGNGIISGTVFEQDGTTPVVGATVTVTGYDEFYGHHTYTYLTDDNGGYSGTVVTGRYVAFASKLGYEDGSHQQQVDVNYDAETSGVDIILFERYNTVGEVVAHYHPDTLDTQSNSVRISWESEYIPDPIGTGWHTYCEHDFDNAVACVKWGYQYPLTELAPYVGSRMTKVALFSDNMYGAVGGNYTCRIYVGGDHPEQGEMVSTITVDVPQGKGDWVEYDLTTPVEVSGEEQIWVIWQANTTVSDYPAGCCMGYLTYGTWWWRDNGYDWGNNPYGIWTMKQYFIDQEGRPVDRAFHHFNVYRTNGYNNGPFTEENTMLLGTVFGDTTYVDVSWDDAHAGVYKWGVSREYAGNRLIDKDLEIPTLPEGEPSRLLRSINAYSFSRYARTVPNGWIQYDPLHPHATASVIDWNLQVVAGDFADDGYMHAYTEDNQLLTFDPGTGQIVAVVNTSTTMDDCAFDYATNTMYGVKNNILYSIDLASGVLTTMGYLDHDVMSHFIRALACSYGGQLYGFLEEFGVMYRIDKTSGHCTLVSQSATMVLHPSMTAGFDHNTETLYWMSVGTVDNGTGFMAMVDVNTGYVSYLAVEMGLQSAFCVPYGYTPTPTSPESMIVWSNTLDKDMWTTVEVNVSTDTGATPAGTVVRLFNTSEPNQGYNYFITLDDSGYYQWDGFRKGTYNYTIEKDGYTSCGNHEIIEIWEPTSLECVLEEMALQARDLYVSPTGWALWNEGLGGDVLHYDTDMYDGSVGASGTPFYWAVQFMPEQLQGYNSINSVSFYDAPGQPFNGAFYIGSTDTPLGHILYQKDFVAEGTGQYVEFPLEQDVTFNNMESLWIVFQYNYSDAPYPASACNNTGDIHGRWISADGLNWSDVASMGLNYTWKIRCHVKAGDKEEKALEFYRVFLDDVFVGTTTDMQLQHEVDNLVEGETYTTSVQAVYSSGDSESVNYTWTYIPCEQYEGPIEFEVEDETDMAVLNWTLPENQISGGEWSYYDNGNFTGSIGTGGSSFYWGIMLPPDLWQGHYLGSVSVFDCAAFTGKIMIYQGGETAPGSLLYSQQYTSTGSNAFIEIPLNQLVELDESQNLWIVVNNVSSAAYPAAYTNDIGNPNSRWISLDGSDWHDITEYNLSGTWMIRAYTTDEMPVVYNILGTMVYRDGELLTETPLPREVQNYADIQAGPGYHDYSIRLVYDDLPICQGDYYAMSCMETTAVTVGVDENEGGQVSIYPNPVNDELTIKAADMTHIRIVNALGQIVYDTELKADETRIPMQRFGSGVYVIHITTANGTFARRVVVYGM